MIEIKVLGSGCPTCKEVERIANKVVGDLQVEAVVMKVTDIDQIMGYDLLSTPGVVVNEKVVSSGRIPSEQQFRDWIIEAQQN